MQSLLSDLLDRLKNTGVEINFIPLEGKRRLIAQAPLKAANILGYESSTVVIAMPDLYPPNVGFPHTTFGELRSGLQLEFEKNLSRKNLLDRKNIKNRFQVFCFKYDLEVLLLAAETQLASRLRSTALKRVWKIPVEDQNHNIPPKRIVENVFISCNDKYRDTIDAPIILGSAHYQDIANACPQNFKPFIDFLESLFESRNL
jgi:hypothetical protein